MYKMDDKEQSKLYRGNSNEQQRESKSNINSTESRLSNRGSIENPSCKVHSINMKNQAKNLEKMFDTGFVGRSAKKQMRIHT